MTRGEGVLVVLPTYCEADNVAFAVGAVLAALPRAEVLVVDDDSPDGTADIVRGLAAADPRVHLLRRGGRRGLGPAYVEGFRRALAGPYRRVVQMDADLSHRPADLPRLVAATDDADLALGSRYAPGGGTPGWSRRRRLLSRLGNAYARAWLGVPVRDLTGGFKCFRREVLEGIDLGAISARGYVFQVEVTWRAWRAGFRIVEVPIAFDERRAGASKMRPAIAAEALLAVPRMRLRPPPRGRR